jgi:hypothetical protein
MQKRKGKEKAKTEQSEENYTGKERRSWSRDTHALP